MNREEKQQVIEELKKKFEEVPNFYMADTSGLTVEEVNALRRICFNRNIEMRVAKNTLIYKALNEEQQQGLEKALKGQTALFFTEISNAPAKVLKEFRKDKERPVLKAAYVEESIYIGDDQLTVLSELKSKNELIGDIIGLMQSPAKNVISALLSGKNKLAGIVKTLSEREEK